MNQIKGKPIIGESPIIILKKEKKCLFPLRILGISGRISSWQLDAYKCLRIFTRMTSNFLITPALMPKIQKWSSILLYYADAFNIESRAYKSNNGLKLGFPEKTFWMISCLKEIEKIKKAEDFYEQKIQEFYIKNYLKDKDVKEKCCILHKEFKNYFIFETKLKNGQILKSGLVGNRTLKYLKERIQAGLNRHKTKTQRALIVNKIKSYRGKL